jgi:hypothetical protein
MRKRMYAENNRLVRPLLSQTITGVSVGGAETEIGATLGVTESDFVLCGGERVCLGVEKKIKKNEKDRACLRCF